jgi:hypothetical protein
MKHYLACLSAELLKARRTIYLLGSILLPLLLAGFNFLLHLGAGISPEGTEQRAAWMSFAHNTYSLGALIVFPVIFVFASTFTVHQEHDNHQWRRLLSMAVPRGAVYLAKLTLTLGLGLLSCLVMWLADLGFGAAFASLRPESGLLVKQMPIGMLLLPFLMIFLLGVLMAGLQFFFSMRVKNFVVSIGAGLALILAGMYFVNVPVLRFIYPWSLPALVYKADTLAQLLLPMAFSLLGLAVTIWFSIRAFIRQDIQD